MARADDTLQFASADAQLKDLCSNYPQFLKYTEQSFKPIVREFVNAANRRLGTNKLWTNNKAECMNRVMKVAVNWKPQHAQKWLKKCLTWCTFSSSI